MMPRRILKQIQAQVLRFPAPVPWTAQPEAMQTVAASLRAMQAMAFVGRHGRRSQGQDSHPADNHLRAYTFFRIVAGSFPESVMSAYLDGQSSAVTGKPSLARPLYDAMLAREKAGWSEYMRVRISARGWDASSCLSQLPALPRTIPQSHSDCI